MASDTGGSLEHRSVSPPPPPPPSDFNTSDHDLKLCALCQYSLIALKETENGIKVKLCIIEGMHTDLRAILLAGVSMVTHFRLLLMYLHASMGIESYCPNEQITVCLNDRLDTTKGFSTPSHLSFYSAAF